MEEWLKIINGLGLLFGLSSIALSYYFTQRKEQKSEIRKEKLEHYKRFLKSLSKIISGNFTAEDRQEYANTYNGLLLFAPSEVLKLIDTFTNSNTSIDMKTEIQTKMMFEIRKDLGIKSKEILDIRFKA